MRRIALGVLWLTIAGLVAAGVYLGWFISATPYDGDFEKLGVWISWGQLVLALAATAAAAMGAYLTFFTPFKPKLEIGSFTWRVRPLNSSSAPVELALWVNLRNEGATSGSLADMAAKVVLPSGEWFLQPVFFVDSEKYLERTMAANDATGLPAIEIFAPILVAKNQQCSRVLLFLPSENSADRAQLEPGVFLVKFYVRYSAEKKFHLSTSRKMVIEQSHFMEWNAGKTIIGAQIERPMDPRPMLDSLKK